MPEDSFGSDRNAVQYCSFVKDSKSGRFCRLPTGFGLRRCWPYRLRPTIPTALTPSSNSGRVPGSGTDAGPGSSL